MYKLLIVEDDPGIAEGIKAQTEAWGLEVRTVENFRNVLAEFSEYRPHIVLLDIMLPKRDGFSVCREIRKKLSTPIIMVTAKEEEIDKVMGLDLGADDYVTKPFSVKVLLARIKANIRRSSGEFVELRQPAPTEGLIVIRGLTIDTKNFRVTKDGREIELSRKEFEVLVFLASHPDELFSREELLEKVWGYEDFFGGIRTVDVTMSRLRSKIEDKPAEPEYILTKRTKGYYIPA